MDETMTVETAEASTAVSNNFVLKWIRFENFRRFENAEITFEREGFTGITGENGAGKSSFMIGLIFALYGKFPDDVRKDGLRHRSVDPKKNPTVVSVGFEHHGQTVEVVRKLSGGNSTATAEVFLDGKEQTVATGGTATDWVTNRLGMDAEGFRTAVVVPQQELTKLVTARPAERRGLIERLAGIEEMNRAVKNARCEENDLSKTVKVLPGDSDAAEALEVEIEALDASLVEDQSSLDTATAQEASVRAERNELNAEMSQHRSVVERHSEAQNAVGSIKHQIELQRMSLDNVNSNLASLRVQFPQSTVPDKSSLEQQVSALREEYKSLSAKVKDFSGRKSGLLSALDGATRRVANQENELAGLTGDLSSLEGQVASIDVNALQDSMRDIEERGMEAQSTVRSMRSKKSDLQESLATLRKHHDDAQCPTCSQDLKDPEALMRSFEDLLVSYDKQEQEASRLVRDLEAEISAVRDELNRAQTLGSQVNQLRERIGRLQDSLTEERANKERFQSEVNELDDSVVREWEARQREVSETGAAVAQDIKEIQKIADGLDNIKRHEDQVRSVESGIQSLEADLVNAQDAVDRIGDVAVSRQRVEECAGKLPGVEARLQDASDAVSSLQVQISTKTTSLGFQKENLDRERALIAKKESELERLSVLAATTALLDEFRKDRISRIAPELSSSATEMISAMTDGAFVEVVVAEDFSTSVVNTDGDKFPVSELSGGERSIVALCLRIAISSLINNENSGLMWFDEALTEQDAKRRAAILNVLRSLPIQQIIMINHTHDAEDIVDKTIRVVRAEESSIVEM